MVEGEPKSAPKAARATSYLQAQKKKKPLELLEKKSFGASLLVI
jgi:hypothetical protein